MTTIPEHTKGALDRYVDHGLEPGGFLTAVLTNDLFGAVARADSENIQALQAIVQYVYNDIPSTCWGSREKMWAHMKTKHLA